MSNTVKGFVFAAVMLGFAMLGRSEVVSQDFVQSMIVVLPALFVATMARKSCLRGATA